REKQTPTHSHGKLPTLHQPKSAGQERKPTSKSTKRSWPTLHPSQHSQTGLGRHPNRPSSTTLPCTPPSTRQAARRDSNRNRFSPSQTRLPCTGRPETTHQKHPPDPYNSLNCSEKSLGKSRRRTAYPQQI
ncbi:hypothetical protein ACHAPU_011548, partial [Fusarium lateritium]